MLKKKKEKKKKKPAIDPNAPLLEKFKFWLKDTGKQLAIAITIVLVIRSSIIEPYKIPSGSMIPTLFIGDHIFVNKFAYGFKVPFSDFFEEPIFLTEKKVPERGDIIVFRYPKDESTNYIKRVIGLPGETILIRNKTVLIDGKPIVEVSYEDPSLSAGIESEHDRSVLSLYMADLGNGHKHFALHDEHSLIGSDYGPITVPKDRLFVMGDNRDRSSDSRVWGFVSMRHVKGKALFIWLNMVLDLDFSKLRFRPSRIGTGIK